MLVDALRAGRIRAGDGAMGTSLKARGFTEGGVLELLNVEKPEFVRKVLDGYASAGAQS